MKSSKVANCFTTIGMVLYFSLSIECFSANPTIPPAKPCDVSLLNSYQKVQNIQTVEKDGEESYEERSVDVRSKKTKGKQKDTDLKISSVTSPRLNGKTKAQRGEVLVKFSKDISPDKKNKLISKHHITLDTNHKVSGLEKIGYHRVKVPFGVDLDQLIINLEKEENVDRVELNVIVNSLPVLANDSFPNEQWSLRNINAIDAWLITEGSPAVLVGIVDSGIESNHPVFRNNTVKGYNFIDDTDETGDCFGHGTQVAGIIAAQEGISTGVAPNCSIMPLKALDANGNGTVADISNAIIYAADHNCKIINLSFGTYYDSDILQKAIEYAWSEGCVLVAAGGNEGTSEACYPAAYSKTVAVGAIDRNFSPCSFSNQASYIDIVAPGKDILTTDLNGENILISGTSFAAAHVSGLAALLCSYREDISNRDIYTILQVSSKDIEVEGWDLATGMGSIDCNSALLCTQTNAPDIGIVDIYTLPANPMPGQRSNLVVTLRNNGISEIKESEIKLERNSEILNRIKIPNLVSKQLLKLNLEWNVLEQQAQTEELLIDVAPLSGEQHLSDNQRQVSVAVTSETIHDIGIVNYSISGFPYEIEKELNLSVTIANFGNTDECNIKVDFFFEDVVYESKNIPILKVGTSKEVFFDIAVSEESVLESNFRRGFKLHANVSGCPEDAMTSNNHKTFRFMLNEDDSAHHIFALHKVDSGEEVHQWIAKEAYDFFVSQIEGSSLYSYLTKPGLTPNSSWSSLAAATHDYDGDNNVLEGSRDEDKAGENPSPIGTDHYLAPYFYHFCAGADDTELEDGLGVWDSAYTVANWYRSSYWTGNNSSSYYFLGHFSHLLADMTVPAHTHNDEHPLSEPYEDDVANYGWYTGFYYNDDYGYWDRVIERPTSTVSLFRATADYTEDYDSEDEAGDWDAGSEQPYSNSKYDSTLYYPLTRHVPSSVDGSGINGMSSSETWATAKDLVPYAIFRTAQAYRYFYYKIDSSGPSVDMDYPSSEDPQNPTLRDNMSSFNLRASASDSQSGTLKEGYQYFWCYWMGDGWSEWYDVSPSPTDSSVPFAPPYDNTYYAFQVGGENGAGSFGWSNVKYMYVETPQAVDDNYEENDTRESAYDLSSREQQWLSSINGLGIQLDDDYYEISVNSGYERVLIDCRFIDADGDIDIELLDSSGTSLADSDSTTNDEYIDYIVPSGGTYYIRVYYGDNGNSYDLWWDDVAPPQPNVSFDSFQIDDDESGGSYGNGNGQVDAGETIELVVTLQNTGGGDAHNVSAHLETSDSYVISISDADEDYGDIASGGTAECSADYDFEVSQNCPDGHVITFNLNPIDSDEDSWSDSFQITVHAPATGSLVVNLSPQEIASGSGQWHLTSGPDTNWKNSGQQIDYLPIGEYMIEYKDVYGWETPESQVITIAESTLSIQTVYLQCTPNPDINSDDHVNIIDFSFIAKEWLQTPCDLINGGCMGADINYSGSVNIEDLLILADHWLAVELLTLCDFESGNLSDWNFGGDSPYWSIDSQEKYSGGFAAKSGAISDDQMTYIYRNQEVPRGYISFYRKVSSEYGNDWLIFYVDGEVVDIAGGESDWKKCEYFIDAGSHTFIWAYQKGSANAQGLDQVWIDDVMFEAQTLDAGTCAWAEMTAYKVLGESMAIQPVQNCGYIPYYETWAIVAAGGSFTGTFECPQAGQYALRVHHQSSYSADCPGEGYSPVTISVNGTEIVSNYDPAENHGGTHGLVTDTWIINANAGANTLEWIAGDLMCTNYWIKKIEVISLD